jgi:hypothetical protein
LEFEAVNWEFDAIPWEFDAVISKSHSVIKEFGFGIPDYESVALASHSVASELLVVA